MEGIVVTFTRKVSWIFHFYLDQGVVVTLSACRGQNKDYTLAAYQMYIVTVLLSKLGRGNIFTF